VIKFSKLTPPLLYSWIVSFLCVVSLISNAQNNDFGVWTTLSIDKKINNKFGANLTEEFRFFQNAQRLNLTYTNLGVNYKINKSIKIAFVYRFIQKYRDENYFSWRHRIYFDAQLKQKYYPFTFVYRARIQSQIRDYYTSEEGKIPERYWRNKFDVRYELGKRFLPYVAAEFRYQFKNDRNLEANNKFNRGRYYLGCQFQYTENKTFDIFFMHQREFNVNNPERNFIAGIEYDFSF
jgi:Protein of unknown function (DUF2490)